MAVAAFKQLSRTEADVSLYFLMLEQERSFSARWLLIFMDSYRENKLKLKLNRVLLPCFVSVKEKKMFTS